MAKKTKAASASIPPAPSSKGGWPSSPGEAAVAMFACAAERDVAKMEALAGAGVPIPTRPVDGLSFLASAIWGVEGPLPRRRISGVGDLAAARFIRRAVELGADPELPGHGGSAPLHVAAFCGAVECVEALLRCGADPDRGDSQGRGAGRWIFEDVNGDLDDGRMACLAALARGGMDFDARFVDPNMDSAVPTTLLLIGIWHQCENAVHLLLDHGASVKGPDGSLVVDIGKYAYVPVSIRGRMKAIFESSAIAHASGGASPRFKAVRI